MLTKAYNTLRYIGVLAPTSRGRVFGNSAPRGLDWWVAGLTPSVAGRPMPAGLTALAPAPPALETERNYLPERRPDEGNDSGLESQRCADLWTEIRRIFLILGRTVDLSYSGAAAVGVRTPQKFKLECPTSCQRINISRLRTPLDRTHTHLQHANDATCNRLRQARTRLSDVTGW